MSANLVSANPVSANPVIAGLCAGLAVLSALVLSGVVDPPQVHTSPVIRPNSGYLEGEGPEAAESFLAEYRRSRLGTWAVEQSHRRTLADGRVITDTQHRAQAPGHSLVEVPGSIDLVAGGRANRCGPGDPSVPADAGAAAAQPSAQSGSGAPRVVCVDAGAAPDAATEVAADVTNLGVALTPSGPRRAPVYAVRTDGQGCWVLRLVLARKAPPFGARATFCFDRRTAAPMFTEVVRAEATDVVRTVAIRQPEEVDFTPGAPRDAQ